MNFGWLRNCNILEIFPFVILNLLLIRKVTEHFETDHWDLKARVRSDMKFRWQNNLIFLCHRSRIQIRLNPLEFHRENLLHHLSLWNWKGYIYLHSSRRIGKSSFWVNIILQFCAHLYTYSFVSNDLCNDIKVLQSVKQYILLFQAALIALY